MIAYHKHTAADIHAWLLSGTQNGLSEQVISKIRAYSLIHNPFITDDSVLVVSATDGNKLVGFVAGFPDHMERPECKCIVGSTLYVQPEYTGDFIGLELVKTLKESYPDYCLIGSDETKSAAIIDKLLGNKIESFDRSRFVLDRTVNIHSFRSFGSRVLEPFRRAQMRSNHKRIFGTINLNIRMEFISMIDSETYQFIVAHSDKDAFLRSQEMLTWTLRYPFSVSAPVQQRLMPQNMFAAQIEESANYAVKLYYKDQLIAVYTIGKRGYDAKLLYLYLDESYATYVYAVVVENVLRMHPRNFYSQYERLNNYIEEFCLALYHGIDKYYYTHPASLPCDPTMQLQGADGDMFA